MNGKDRATIIKKLNFPENFIKKGPLAYKMVKKDDLFYLVGFFVDNSIDNDSFYVQHFIQPLFIEFTTFVFTLGHRVGGIWNKDNISDLQMSLEPFFLKVPNNVPDIINYINGNFKNLDNLFKYQSLSYSYVLVQEKEAAIKELKKVSFKDLKTGPLWKQKELGRINTVLDLMEKNEFNEIRAIFGLWQQATLDAIKLTLPD